MASVLYLALLLSLSCVLWNGADAGIFHPLYIWGRRPIPRPTIRTPAPATAARILTPAPTTPAPTTPAPTTPSCPSGWTKYGNRCFQFQNAQRDWASAERACTGLGANLASVHNSAEQRFLKDLVNSNKGSYLRTWVGGYDAVKEGVWLWSDGSQFTSAPWGSGEPNNAGIENCMEINLLGSAMFLNDIACNNNFFYICAKKV